jgi:hypothetical protein
MKHPEGPAAPASGTTTLPTFEELAADPEIAALIDFKPVAMRARPNGWNTQAQRAYIAILAMTGSRTRACTAIGRKTASLDACLKHKDAAAFAEAQERAFALFRRREAARFGHSVAALQRAEPAVQAPGQLLNEQGDYEDEDSLRRRGEEAGDRIRGKLLRSRRMYLAEISRSSAKRAAFEILTQLPIDWDKAERLEPQADEPFNRCNQRKPDMILAAESGWTFGEIGYGPDKKAEIRQAIDEWRAAEGLEPVDWDEEEEGR